MEALIKPESGLIFWTVFIFAILVFILAKTVWKPLLKSIEDRENKIKSDIESAAKSREEAQKIKEEIDEKLRGLEKEINEKLSIAQSQANEEREKIIQEAKREAENIINNAKKEIDNYKIKTEKEIENKLVEIAIQASKKVLSDIIDEKINAKLEESFSKEFAASAKRMK